MPPIPADKRLAGLDHLRAFAILFVFVYHYRVFGHPPLVDTLGAFGWTGVDLFFVLSGYLIAGQLLSKVARQQPISYGEFYFKRALRILPAYLVVLALYFFIPAFKERSQLPPLWKFLTFTQNFGLNLVTRGAFSHAWSLCIEEQFYLVLPLFIILLTAAARTRPPTAPVTNDPLDLAALPPMDSQPHSQPPPKTRHTGHRTIGWLLPILFLAGLAARLFNWYHFLEPIRRTPEQEGFGPAYYQWIYYPTYTRLDGLLAGVALAAIYHFRPDVWLRITRYGNRLLALSIVLLAGAWWVCHGDSQYSFRGAIFGYTLVSLAYCVLVLAALSPTCILYRYSSRFTKLIAALSYPIYLTHKQLIHLMHGFFTKRELTDNSYLLFGICVVVCFIGGWILNRIVEKPFMKLRDRLLARKKVITNRTTY